MGPSPATVTVTDASSSFIITPSMAVAVMVRLSAAKAVEDGQWISAAFRAMAVVRQSNTFA